MTELTEKSEKKAKNLLRIAPDLAIPPANYNKAPFTSVEDVRRAFGLPASLGLKTEARIAMDSAFDGYGAIYESLTQHAVNLGQYPMTSFIGYGVLQQIAQNGMIRACIQTVADDMTREWITITGGDKSDSDKISQLQDISDNGYKLRSMFNKAFSTVGYMGGCFIYIDTGIEEDDDLVLPLVISSNNDELVNNSKLQFTIIDPVNVSPSTYNSDNPLRADYMIPKYWWVLGKKVHASRLITLLDNPPPVLLRPAYNFLGIPQAQILWDYVLHWNKARETGVNILEKLNFMVFQTNVDEILSSGGLGNLDVNVARMSRYRDNNSIFVCDKDTEDVKNVTLQMGGVVDIVRQSLEHIASINRTPAVKLLGISPSGFNATGESDIRNYYDHIRSKQELNRDSIQTVLKCIQLASFGEIDPSITFKFNELGTEDESATASTAKTKVDMLSALLDRNVISAEEVRSSVRNDPMTGLDFIGEELPEPVEGQLQTEESDEGNEIMNQYLAKKEGQETGEQNQTEPVQPDKVNANETETQTSSSEVSRA